MGIYRSIVQTHLILNAPRVCSITETPTCYRNENEEEDEYLLAGVGLPTAVHVLSTRGRDGNLLCHSGSLGFVHGKVTQEYNSGG